MNISNLQGLDCIFSYSNTAYWVIELPDKTFSNRLNTKMLSGDKLPDISNMQDFLSIIAPQYITQVKEAFLELFEHKNDSVTFEYSVNYSEGAKWFKTSVILFKGLDNQEIIHVLTFDITNEKNRIAALTKIEEQNRLQHENATNSDMLSSIFRASPTGIGVVKNRVIKSVNPKLCEMLGYSAEELNEQSARILYSSDEEYNYVGDEKYRQITEIGTGTVETVWKKKDGSELNIILSSSPIDLNDLSKGVTFTALDITERIKIEQENEREKQFSEMLISSLPGIFYMFDSNMRIVRWNKNKEDFLNLRGEDMLRHNVLDSIYAEDKQKLINTVQKIFAEGEGHDIIRLIRHDGAILSYHLTGVRLMTKEGAYLLGVGFDVSQLVETENELRLARERAEESDRLKTAFLQNISHEIRTPLNGIVGFSEALQDDKITVEERNDYINMIRLSVDRLISIVSNIIEIAKIETGQLEIHEDDFNLDDLLNDLYSFHKSRALTKGIKLNIEKNSGAGNKLLFSDRQKILNILSAFLDNALKFTESGSIDFGYRFTEKSEIQFFVRDTGIGVKQQDLHRIFNKFEQVVSSSKQLHEGAGIGLAIAKGLSEALKASIQVESEFMRGSTFYLTIPQRKIKNNKYSTQKMNFSLSVDLSRFNVLVVEDDWTNYKYFEQVLKKTGIRINHVINGIEAVKQCKNMNDIDIVLMDINIPGINGYEALRMIKNFKPSLPVIAQSAYSLSDFAERTQAAGFDGYLTKPIDKEKLFSILSKILIK